VTGFRALLACLWLLFSLTGTAAPPAMAENMSCHMDQFEMGAMDMTDMPATHHKPDAPTGPQTLMPCCSQPVLAASAEPIRLLSRPYEPARLIPAPAAPLNNLPTRLEPRPPKIV